VRLEDTQDRRERERSSNLERHGMIDETTLAKHELGTFIGELEKHVNLVSEVPEEEISWFPAKYEKTEGKLETETPQNWTPSHLTTAHLTDKELPLPRKLYICRILCICPSVCNSKSYKRILMKFCGEVERCARRNRLAFGGDLDFYFIRGF